MDELIGRSILVTGRVQGVFYRKSTVDNAINLDLRGSVKNLPSGEVSIEVFGKLEAVEELIEWCKQGPPLSNVIDVSVEEIPFRESQSFKISY